ncbi:aspartate aminotransferase [Candidatus Bathyarchaeota archaeon ex4484_205]|nr:MAG: aspartate aminotransferase [Candidatus Bathyarchaeota archaeon ex4484_205]
MEEAKRLSGVGKSVIRELFDLAQGKGNVINLGIGEPDFDTPENIKEAAIRALRENKTHYTPNPGEKYSSEYGLDYDPDEVVVTVGACEAMYDVIVKLAQGVPVRAKCFEEDEFVLKPEQVQEKITDKTKMILINSPSNPTGAVMGKKEIRGIVELAEDNEIILVSDEVYEKIVYDATHYCAAQFSHDGGVIVVNSFSKTYAMTGWRVGYAIGRRDLISPVALVHQYSVANANSIAQYAALEALRGPQDFVREVVREYKKRRDILIRELRKHGIKSNKPEGAFYLFPNIGEDSREFSRKAINAGVAVVPGEEFGEVGKNNIRISYATSVDNLIKGAEILGKVYREGT